MSLILDALNKADKERQVQKDSALSLYEHQGGEIPTENDGLFDKSKWVAFIVILLVVIAVLLVALLLKPKGPVTKPAVSPVYSERITMTDETNAVFEDVTSQVVSVKQVLSSSPVGTTTDKSTTDHAKVEGSRTSSQDPSITSLYAKSQPQFKAIKSSRPNEPALRLAEAKKIARELDYPDPRDRLRQDALVEQLLEKVGQETAMPIPSSSIDSYSDVPYLHELSGNNQTRIPSINYSNHIYSNNNGAVVLNDKTIKVEGSLGGGVMVEKILSDGVILNYSNEFRFKLGALSSWVNVP